ncbi:MAG: serine/threonine protein kinase, partial [Lentisphaeria bacterium]|nr:serine/threonine protein kinase [Lentisphaeria bacterium]
MSNGSESVEYEVYDGEKIDINAEDVIREFVKKGLIGDRYCDLKKIAEGGMGEVMLGKDVGLLRKTVLKIIHPRLLKNSDQFARFITEARITGQLEHPNIVPVHDLGILDGELLYFSMKYIEGKELGQILESLRLGDPKSQRFSIFSLLTIFRKICDAVAYAHSKGIIHRDIKPDNIMVGNYGEVLLVDWGLARHVDEPLEKASPTATKDFFDEDNPGSATRTRDGIIKGTPAFMSPEQALGEVEIVNASTDIFLLGATLYAIATLEAPYAVSSKDDIYKIL